MKHAIEHNPAEHRFEYTEDDLLSFLSYDRQGDILVLTHTEVPKALGGRGIAGDLVRAALGSARTEGLKVRAVCSYAAAFMERHPEFNDLRA